MKLILALGAIVCFLLDAFHVAATVSWTPLGYALVTAAIFIPV